MQMFFNVGKQQLLRRLSSAASVALSLYVNSNLPPRRRALAPHFLASFRRAAANLRRLCCRLALLIPADISQPLQHSF